ncbi:PstS family phosphate ABC transporter substrate-binding protein [Nocardia sp. NPDC051750]|uniref:PstS family phosphate ABC transporter substrate-binding protein n=1 Tax=Nocardia sp. NPDC051750 TaxID=3364325 RepID=UPI003790A0FC
MGSDLFFGVVLPLAGIAIPVGAFVWEFVFVGRKRLGWRVQMDTPVTGEAESGHAGALRQLRQTAGGAERNLQDLSVVLVRIENNGTTTIDATDYVTGQNGQAGLHLHFPRRRVIGMAVTELSQPGLAVCFEPDSGFGHRELTGQSVGVIDLPKVPLSRSDHYKILATLERTEGTGDYPEPTMQGVVTGGGITKTRGRSGVSKLMLGLTGFLVTVIAAMAVVDIVETDAPSGCATGRLTVVGSTAWKHVIEDAGSLYEQTCPGSDLDYAFGGSELGMTRVTDERGGDGTLLAIGDAPKGSDFPELEQRPLALSLFSVVVHPSAEVTDLSVEQIRDLFLGKVTNWRQVGGADLPVRVVNRYAGSGTRWNFETGLLETGQPLEPSITCNKLLRDGGPGRCQTGSTGELLGEVAEMPGAVGYSEYADAAGTAGVDSVTIGDVPASRDAVAEETYPFWGVEYAFSYGDFAPGSIGASFVRFLLQDAGQDVIRSYGNLPCAELADPSRCHPQR